MIDLIIKIHYFINTNWFSLDIFISCTKKTFLSDYFRLRVRLKFIKQHGVNRMLYLFHIMSQQWIYEWICGLRAWILPPWDFNTEFTNSSISKNKLPKIILPLLNGLIVCFNIWKVGKADAKWYSYITVVTR